MWESSPGTYFFDPDGEQGTRLEADIEPWGSTEKDASRVGFIHFCIMLEAMGYAPDFIRWPKR